MSISTRQALLVATLLIVIITALKHVTQSFAAMQDIAFIAVVFFQTFVPMWLIKERTPFLSRREYALDLGRALALSLFAFPVFWIGYNFLQHYFAAQHGMKAYFEFSVPQDFLRFFLSSVVIVSFAEETFFRGYLQPQLSKSWSLPTVFVVTNFFFALGHFMGDYHVARLLTFFPGLLFSYLAFRSQSIYGAVVFHGLCNMFAELIQESYYWK